MQGRTVTVTHEQAHTHRVGVPEQGNSTAFQTWRPTVIVRTRLRMPPRLVCSDIIACGIGVCASLVSPLKIQTPSVSIVIHARARTHATAHTRSAMALTLGSNVAHCQHVATVTLTHSRATVATVYFSHGFLHKTHSFILTIVCAWLELTTARPQELALGSTTAGAKQKKKKGEKKSKKSKKEKASGNTSAGPKDPKEKKEKKESKKSTKKSTKKKQSSHALDTDEGMAAMGDAVLVDWPESTCGTFCSTMNTALNQRHSKVCWRCQCRRGSGAGGWGMSEGQWRWASWWRWWWCVYMRVCMCVCACVCAAPTPLALNTATV